MNTEMPFIYQMTRLSTCNSTYLDMHIYIVYYKAVRSLVKRLLSLNLKYVLDSLICCSKLLYKVYPILSNSLMFKTFDNRNCIPFAVSHNNFIKACIQL